MPCGCKKRMEKLEEKAPAVARVIRPVHDVAMKLMDKVTGEKDKPEMGAFDA